MKGSVTHMASLPETQPLQVAHHRAANLTNIHGEIGLVNRFHLEEHSHIKMH